MDSHQEEREAYQAALRYLAARPRTVAETEARLRRSFGSATAGTVTARLVREGLLDDRAFALQWRESRQRLRPRSAALLRYEMVQRGVPPELAEEAVTSLDNEGLAYQAARQYVQRLSGVEGATFRRRLAQHLYRRGFGHGVVRRTLVRLNQEWRQTDASEGRVLPGDDND